MIFHGSFVIYNNWKLDLYDKKQPTCNIVANYSALQY